METTKSTAKRMYIKRSAHTYGLIIFALVTLFNPNVNVIDLLPDFIGFLILASFFEKGEDAAPYFDEAAVGCKRLALVSILKIPALIIIVMARSKNALDNDIIALMSVVFSAVEIALIIPTVKNIFSALFYLGERTDAEALIRNDKGFCADNLVSLTYIFFIYKSVVSALAECLKLTRTVNGSYVTGSNIYPYFVLTGGIIALIGGTVWLIRSIRYVKGIRDEGDFYDALETMLTAEDVKDHEVKSYRRSTFRAFFLFTVGTVLTLKFNFDNFHDINLIPPFLSLLFMLAAIRSIGNKTNGKRGSVKTPTVIALLAVLLSFAAYALEINFAVNYGYAKLLYDGSTDAVRAYKAVIAAGAAELVFTCAFLASAATVLNKFIVWNIGLSPEDEGYMTADKKFHGELMRMTYIFTGLGIAAAVCRFAEICLDGNVTLILTDGAHSTAPYILSGSLPWFGAVVTLLTVVYIFYALYYFSTLKDEIRGIKL